MSKLNDTIFDLNSYIRRDKEKGRAKDDDTSEASEKPFRKCDSPGCNREGLYKAPKGPDNLKEYYYFCLDHVREYNKAWNFFAGRSDEFLEDYILKDITGHRPTWPMGNIPGTASQRSRPNADYFRSAFQDPFDMGEHIFEKSTDEKRDYAKNKKSSHAKSDDGDMIEACAILDISYPPDLNEARESYKFYVKKYHPDVNRDDPTSEKKLQKIISAFHAIKNSFELR
ncbi:MAG: J domain-containing protein [Pseudomonadota bacterium]